MSPLNDSPGNTSISGIVTAGLISHLDANFADGGTVAPSNGCAVLTWFDLTGLNISGALNSFTACSATSGWNGDGSSSSPYALVTDGTSNYVEITKDARMLDDTHTVEMWVKVANPTLSGLQNLFASHITAGSRGWLLGFLYDGHYSRFYYQAGDGIAWTGYSAYSANITTAGWYHVVGTHDLDHHRLYVNGSLTSSIPGGHLPQSVANLWFGRNPNSPAAYYPGTVSKLALYDRALSSAEVYQNCVALQSRFGVTCSSN